MGKLKTHKDFLKDLLAENIEVEVLERYKNSSTPILCECKKCKTQWKIRPNNLLRGYGCPECGIKKRSAIRTKSTEVFINELSSINPTIEIVGAYIGARTNIKCKCCKCGNLWEAMPTNLLKGKGCPKCAKIIVGNKFRKTQGEFENIIRLKNPNLEPIGKYRGRANRVLMKCNMCNYQWNPTASSILVGYGCPRCAGNGIYTPEEFIEKMHKVNPFISIEEPYQRAHIPIRCKCLHCSKEWLAKPNNLLSGKGCPECNHASTSFMEQVICEGFSLIVGRSNVKTRDRKTIGKELDVYIPSLNIAIETGSWNWHHDKVDTDMEKRILCKKAGIRLITIYSDYPYKELPFEDDCICVKEALGFEQDFPVVKKVINQLFKLLDINFEIPEESWKEIVLSAYISSRRMSTDQFKEKMATINDDVQVLGEYTGAWNRIKCKCKNCGNEWHPIANNLIRGHGCLICAHKANGDKKRKTHEQFSKDLFQKNPNIRLIGEYVGSTKNVKCKCLICEYEWDILPTNLFKRCYCPKCNKEKN